VRNLALDTPLNSRVVVVQGLSELNKLLKQVRHVLTVDGDGSRSELDRGRYPNWMLFLWCSTKAFMAHSCVVRYQEHTAVSAFLLYGPVETSAHVSGSAGLAYRLTASFPKSETYGLTSQMRRAAVSIPANIAEGFRRRSQADKARFLNMAEGSLEDSGF
jgi:hypothetical protein